MSLQDGATVYRLRAREVRGEEKARWWLVAERDWPHFSEFRVKAGDRETNHSSRFVVTVR